MKAQGFDIEGVSIEYEQPFWNLAMAALIAAVTVQQLVHARDGKRGLNGDLLPITNASAPEDDELLAAYCDKLEGETAREKKAASKSVSRIRRLSLRQPRRLEWILRKPGPIALLNGWQQFQAGKAAIFLIKKKRYARTR